MAALDRFYCTVKHQVILFADISKVVLLLWILFVIYVSCLSLLCCLVCCLQPCGHLLGKGLPLGSLVRLFSCVFVTFPYCVPGPVWYLIVSFPDLCLPLYLAIQGSYMQVRVKFKDISRTSKRLSYYFQGLKTYEKYWFTR